MDRLLTIRELAVRLNIANGTAFDGSERVASPVRLSSRVRFRESAVEKMIDQLGQATGDSRTFRRNQTLGSVWNSVHFDSLAWKGDENGFIRCEF